MADVVDGEEYTVQVLVPGDREEAVWKDVATVPLPRRSKRARALEKARPLIAAAIEEGTVSEVRVLDARSAMSQTVKRREFTPADLLEIG